MKTIIALLFTVNMFAANTPIHNVNADDYIDTYYYNPSITIRFENWKSGDLNIRIVSAEKGLVYSETVNTTGSNGVRYNLSHLQNGKYRVYLENDQKVVEETIILFDGKIVEKEAEVKFKPSIVKEGNNLYLNFLSLENEARVEISNASNIVYEKTYADTKSINEIFNIENLSSGRYTLTVSNGNVSETYAFRK